MYALFLTYVVLFAGCPLGSEDELAVDHNAPLLASDLEFEKWNITAKVTPTTVLSLVHLVRVNGKVLAFETKKYSNTSDTISASLLIGNAAIFQKPESIVVRAPSGSVNIYDVDGHTSHSVVKTSEFQTIEKFQLVGSVTYSTNESEKVMIAMFAKIGPLQEYPKLRKAISKAEQEFGSGCEVKLTRVDEVQAIPTEIAKRLQ